LNFWWRDEFTSECSWRAVVNTFVNHPSEVHHLTYIVRGPPGGKSIGYANYEEIPRCCRSSWWSAALMTPTLAKQRRALAMRSTPRHAAHLDSNGLR
jgi:hypothetical protein